MARSTQRRPESPQFFPHIQGLRAIAVLLVVVYHFWPARLTGGYIGVDVFFVISGFLITGQLSRELAERKGINLPEFWAKRIRRLVPASLFVLVVSVAITAFVLPLANLHESLWDITASSLYWQNWHLAAGSVNYLASSGHTIAEHYWSLSLEEQFYVVWPLILLGAASLGTRLGRQGRWSIAGVVVLVAVVSYGASVWFTATNPAEAYFVLFTRMWEFAAGAMLVVFPTIRARTRWQSNLVGFAGLVLLLMCAIGLTPDMAYPGWVAILPVIATVALLSVMPDDNAFGATRILSVRPLRFIGDISYSLYLWHWPLIIAAPFIIGWGLSAVNRIVLFVASFVLAWITKRFVEDTFRRFPALVSRKPRFTFGWMFIALGVTGALIAVTFITLQPKYEAAAAELRAVTENPPECFGAASITGCSNPELSGVIIPSPDFGSADRPEHEKCFVQLNESRLVSCSFGSTDLNAPQVALIGDSHAYQYLDALIRQAEENGWALTTYLKGACPWTTTDPRDSNPAFVESCRQWRNNLATELAQRSDFDVVITSALSSALVESSGTPELAAAAAADAWERQSKSARVVVILDNPRVPFDPNNCLRADTIQSCVFDRRGALEMPDPLGLAADRVAGSMTVDFTDVYCGATTCNLVVAGANVYRDQDHLTRTFANTAGPTIAATVSALLRAGR